jgi:hypothetical protein
MTSVRRALTSTLPLLALLGTLALLGRATATAPAATAPPGPATLRLEVVAAGRDDGLPPDPATLLVRSTLDGSQVANVGTNQLTTSGGGQCPGVGPLCSIDLVLTVETTGSHLVVSVDSGPSSRLPVYSGACDGIATPTNQIQASVVLVSGDTRTCRVTFVRPDSGGVTGRDSALLVNATFDHDRTGAGRPDQVVELRGGGTSVESRSFSTFRNLANPSTPCPLATAQPACGWALTYDYDGFSLPLMLTQSAQAAWLPIFGGDCDARGRLPNRDLGGELIACTLYNVGLEAQASAARNAALRIEVVEPAAAGLSSASILVRSSTGAALATLSTPAMLTSAGAPCLGLGAALCSGDMGLEAPTTGTGRFSVHVDSAPLGYTPVFSGGCTPTGSVVPAATIDLAIGVLGTCRVTFAAPPVTLSVGDAVVREGNAGGTSASVQVRLDRAAPGAVTATFATFDGSAAAPSDYTGASGTVTIPAGQLSAAVPVTIVGDILGEADETFTVRLTSAAGAVLGDSSGLVTIQNDDDRVPPVIGAKTDVLVESKLGPVAVVYTQPPASDNLDGAVAVSCVAPSGAKFAFGTTRVTCTATDRNGNVATRAFNVVVRLPTTPGAVTEPGRKTTEPLLDVSQGQRVQVDAGGFAPGNVVTLVFITATGEEIAFETTKAAKDGRFDVKGRIPGSAPLGASQMTALGLDAAGAPFVRAWLLNVVLDDGDDEEQADD